MSLEARQVTAYSKCTHPHPPTAYMHMSIRIHTVYMHISIHTHTQTAATTSVLEGHASAKMSCSLHCLHSLHRNHCQIVFVIILSTTSTKFHQLESFWSTGW